MGAGSLRRIFEDCTCTPQLTIPYFKDALVAVLVIAVVVSAVVK
jgi:hypothetical protein